MGQLKGLWRWMLGVMVLMQLGIFLDYWGDFASNTWAVHAHYWNATLWFGLLILQPWMIERGRLAAHRTWGMIGLMLAGGMVLLSASQLNRDIVYANSVRDNPENWGPFEPWFFFQIMMAEMVLVSAFAVAVVMAIVKRKSLQDHAWWMASTAFITLMPALGRGIQNVWIMTYGFSADVRFVQTHPLLVTQGLIIAFTLLFAWRFGKLKHPATWLAIIANALYFILEPLARSPEVQEFWRAFIMH